MNWILVIDITAKQILKLNLRHNSAIKDDLDMPGKCNVLRNYPNISHKQRDGNNYFNIKSLNDRK